MNKHIHEERNLYPVSAKNVFSKLPHLWLDHSSKWWQLKTCLSSHLHMPASSLWVLSLFHLPGLRSPADYKGSPYIDICSHLTQGGFGILPFYALLWNPFSPVTTANPILPKNSVAERNTWKCQYSNTLTSHRIPQSQTTNSFTKKESSCP